MTTLQTESAVPDQMHAIGATSPSVDASASRRRWSRRFKQLGVVGFAFFLIKGLAWLGVGLVVYLAS